VCSSYMSACVCLELCVRKCAMKVMDINKYMKNCDDVKCNLKVEIKIDVNRASSKATLIDVAFITS